MVRGLYWCFCVDLTPTRHLIHTPRHACTRYLTLQQTARSPRQSLTTPLDAPPHTPQHSCTHLSTLLHTLLGARILAGIILVPENQKAFGCVGIALQLLRSMKSKAAWIWKPDANTPPDFGCVIAQEKRNAADLHGDAPAPHRRATGVQQENWVREELAHTMYLSVISAPGTPRVRWEAAACSARLISTILIRSCLVTFTGKPGPAW
mmetsp:Transcript_3358/g.6388  ORF Transcript_3358/g.6388 Transcript_3358/m.6388 type:complete len:207 (+) Transcript_3358:556-1176(+)